MILQTRKPDRRRFKSSLRTSIRRKREYYYSFVTVLVVKIVLLVFLCILFSTTLRVFYSRFSGRTPFVRFSVPVLVLVMIVVLIWFIVKNIKELKNEYNNLH